MAPLLISKKSFQELMEECKINFQREKWEGIRQFVDKKSTCCTGEGIKIVNTDSDLRNFQGCPKIVSVYLAVRALPLKQSTCQTTRICDTGLGLRNWDVGPLLCCYFWNTCKPGQGSRMRNLSQAQIRCHFLQKNRVGPAHPRKTLLLLPTLFPQYPPSLHLGELPTEEAKPAQKHFPLG